MNLEGVWTVTRVLVVNDGHSNGNHGKIGWFMIAPDGARFEPRLRRIRFA